MSAASGERRADYLDRARRLAPRIAALAERIEAERRLPPELLAALHEAGLFRMLLPRPFGGAELDPLSFAMVIEEVAAADASTAWCLCQASGCSMAAAFLPPEIAAEIWREPHDVLAWGPGAGARAIAVAGGYRVTGEWAFASGGRHATWLGGQCSILEADGTPRRRADGKPLGRTMLFRAEQAQMRDIWHVIGLRGTASDAFAVDGLFVPEAYTLSRDDQSERRYPGPLYCFPANSLYGSGFSSIALALARETLAAFIRLCLEKTPRGFTRPLRENAVVQAEVARSQARLGAARLLLHQALAEIWPAVERENRIALDQRMRIRLAATHAITECSAVVDAAYHLAGATAIFNSGPFERRFRDIHTVAQQIQGRPSHYETVGQFMLGLEADTAFL
jgi:indole-3-acetate monooxygenase